MSVSHQIFGTTPFDGTVAMRGYALNKMCYSFNGADSPRKAFKRRRGGLHDQVQGLNDQQKEAIRKRCVLDLIAAGSNVYYLAKFAGIFGLDVQDVGAQQTGMTKDEFKAMLVPERSGRIDFAIFFHVAKIVGGIATSHIPAVGNAIARKLTAAILIGSRFSMPLIRPVHKWLAEVKPDIAIVLFYNDHGLELLPRQDADLRHWRSLRICEPGRGLGHPDHTLRSKATRRSPGTSSTNWLTTSSTKSAGARKWWWITALPCRCSCSGPTATRRRRFR